MLLHVSCITFNVIPALKYLAESSFWEKIQTYRVIVQGWLFCFFFFLMPIFFQNKGQQEKNVKKKNQYLVGDRGDNTE